MASDKDYIDDGIKIFEKSKTGQGIPFLPFKQPQYVNRYKQLAKDVVVKLNSIHTNNKIGFEAMNDDGYAIPKNGPIKLANKFKSPSKLSLISSILVHEAAHCCKPSKIGPNYVPDELLCRTVECLFYMDLITDGVNIDSKVFGKPVKIRMNPNDGSGQLKEMYRYFTKGQLIDYVLSIDVYRADLEAGWIQNNSQYWGGFKNRWPQTLGYFIGTLAKSPNPSRNNMILNMMMVASDRGKDPWLKMIREATRTGFPAAKIKSALSGYLIPKKDIDILKKRINKWGLATQKNNGLDCLP